MGNYNDLLVYKKAFGLAMKIFSVSKSFPAEEKFALTNQIRRSSRSVCANLAESYTRRKFRNYFLSKLNDVESENAETQVWLDFAFNCSYITPEKYKELSSDNNEIGKLTWFMINNVEKFFKTKVPAQSINCNDGSHKITAHRCEIDESFKATNKIEKYRCKETKSILY